MLSIEYLQQCNNNLIDHCDTNIPGLGEQATMSEITFLMVI